VSLHAGGKVWAERGGGGESIGEKKGGRKKKKRIMDRKFVFFKCWNRK